MTPNSLVKDELAERQAFIRRTLIFFVLALGLVLVLVARMLYLQVWQYELYRTRSEDNRMEVVPVAPARGLIFDRNGKSLAENRPVFNLVLVRERIEDLDQFIAELAAIVPISEDDIELFHKRAKRVRRPFEPVVLKAGLEHEEVAALAVDRHRLPGLEIEQQVARFYPYGDVAAHAIGSVRRISKEDLETLDPIRYVGTNFIGKRGVEKFYENTLHGEVGSEWVETDAYGRKRKVLAFKPPAAGQNITLQLDINVQIAAVGALGNRRGAVVAISPQSGGILALVSWPSYDPNEFVVGMEPQRYQELTQSEDRPLLNRAVNGQYAPGSTIKPFLGLAALAAGVVDWEEEILDRGEFKLPGSRRVYRGWNWKPHDAGGQGVVNLNRAIYRSSNIFFYSMGARLDVGQITSFLHQFGYGEGIAADIAGASTGLVPSPAWKQGTKGEPWYPGDNLNLSIGQGDLLVTPLQAAAAAAVLATRGRRLRPRMLLASDGSVEEAELAPLKPVVGPSADDWERMVNSMEDVIHRHDGSVGHNGTAWHYIGRGIGYRMAGKSGTAQVVEIKQGEAYDKDERDERNRNHAWFIAFAPADDPVIAVSVIVENGGGGSSVAAPVARDIVDAYLLPRLAVR